MINYIDSMYPNTQYLDIIQVYNFILYIFEMNVEHSNDLITDFVEKTLSEEQIKKY